MKGPHRYVFVLYEQSSEVEATAPNEREKFKLEKFAKDNNLGDPLAGNFFYRPNRPGTITPTTTEATPTTTSVSTTPGEVTPTTTSTTKTTTSKTTTESGCSQVLF